MEQLVHLDPVTHVSPVVTRVLGLNPGKYTLQGSNVYVIGSGSRRILLDTGEGKSEFIPLLLSALQAPGTQVEITDVIISHWHHDHTGGIASVREAFPNAKFWQFPLGGVAESNKKDEGNSTSATCDCATKEVTEKQTSMPQILPLQDGQLFPVPDDKTSDAEPLSLRVVHCPGHTADHVALVLEPAPPGENHPVLFSGDCILGQGSAVFESLSEYLASLRKLLDSVSGDDCVIYPAHGPVVRNGAAKIQEYIDHRLLREKQIVGVLTHQQQQKQAYMSAMEVVDVIYKEHRLGDELKLAACHSVLLHLQKLKVDGVVTNSEADSVNEDAAAHHKRWHLVAAKQADKVGML